MFNSANGIEQTLLKGDALTWVDPDTNKSQKIRLDSKEQRSLLRFLLSSSERDAGNISEKFITDIKEAYLSEDDPAVTNVDDAEINAPSSSWRLKKIETYGYGGINLFENTVFSYDLDGKGVCLEGENGSGKSSLVSAIQWALTGQIIKDRTEEKNLEIPDTVYDNQGKNIALWPPVASYPQKKDDFKKQPFVWVELTFIEPNTSEIIKAKRTLQGEIVSVEMDSRLKSLISLFEPSILMPSRVPHINLSSKTTNLVDAIQKLTGLDPLADLGEFVSGRNLGNSARLFLKYSKNKGLDQKQAQFEQALKMAHEVFENDTNNIPQFKNRISSKELEADLEKLEQNFSASVAEKLAVLKSELPNNFKPEENLQKVRDAVSNLSNSLNSHKDELITAAIKLSEVSKSINNDLIVQIDQKIDETIKKIGEAIVWQKRRNDDSKLQLKLIAAQYHQESHGDGEINNCPLCEEFLGDKPTLSVELSNLKKEKAAASKVFADRIRELRDDLLSLIPKFTKGGLEDYSSINPRADFVGGLRKGIIENESVKGFLVGVENLLNPILENALKTLPSFDMPKIPINVEWGAYSQLSVISSDIQNIKRLCSLAQWWTNNKEQYTSLWATAIGVRNAEKKYPENTVQGRLSALNDALEHSKPFDMALSNIKLAKKNALEWQEIKAEQDIREAITEALEPLSNLRKYVEAQSKSILDALSDDISKIYNVICASERLSYNSTKISKKNILIQGQLHKDYIIDATLIANTSWLRAILWSFIFALRNATVDKIGYNPFPLMILDDPQATFDSKHKRKWAEHICNLSKEANSAQYATQFFITSHDMQFVNSMMKIEEFNGSFGQISYANSTTNVLVIADGIEMERKWSAAETSKSQKDGIDYLMYMRTYIETLLKIMLQGEAPNVSTMILKNLRDLVIDQKSKKVSPFNYSAFEDLINNTEPGIKNIKNMQEAHHSSDGTIGYNEAKDVHAWWHGVQNGKRGFKEIILNTFDAYREYRLINGEPRSPFAASLFGTLPEGFKDTLANQNIAVKGKVAALSDGRPCDGCFSLEEREEEANIRFFNHSAYRITASTLEPVANYGDIVIVSNYEPINADHNNLVVVATEEALLARRYTLVADNPQLVALVSQAINPINLKLPRIKQASALENNTKKIIGVLFADKKHPIPVSKDEIVPVEGESFLTQAIKDTSLFEIKGRSAEPYALDGQYLLVGKPCTNQNEVVKLDGDFVFAVDNNNNNYFKRLRVFQDGRLIALESLDLSGKEETLIFSDDPLLNLPSVKQIAPVKGVIFNLPQQQKKKSEIAA